MASEETKNEEIPISEASRNINSDEENEEYQYAYTDHSLSSSDNEMVDNELEPGVCDPIRCQTALAKMICCDYKYMPLMAESGTKLFQMMNPDYRKPDENAVRNECLKIYGKKKLKLNEKLRNFRGRISLRIDMWKADEGLVDYMCLSAHFVTDEWKLRKWVMNFRMVEFPLDEEEVFKVFGECMKEWDIEGKVGSVVLGSLEVSDSLSVMVKDYFGEKCKGVLNGCLFGVRCFRSFIYQMVQDGLNEISELYDEFDLIAACKQFERANGSRGIIYAGLKNFAGLKECFSGDDLEEDGFGEKLTEDEWKKVEGMCVLLEIVYSVTSVLSKVKCPTANIYFHNLWDMRMCLVKESVNPDTFISAIAKKMVETFDRYWKDMFLVLALPAVMDPRFKMKYIEFFSLKHGSDEAGSCVTLVLEAVRGLYDEYVARQYETSPTSADSEIAGSNEIGNLNCVDWLQDYHQFVASTSQPTKSELDWYFDEPVVPGTTPIDVLSWWKTNSSKYPTLSRMARDILAIPISIATSGSAFYTEAIKLDLRLWREESLIEALMCTESWSGSK